jgi:hypothetical protein
MYLTLPFLKLPSYDLPDIHEFGEIYLPSTALFNLLEEIDPDDNIFFGQKPLLKAMLQSCESC